MLRLKQVRMAHGESQKELASALGIGVSSLSQYENGKREPDFQTLTKIADYFAVSVDYLLGREDRTQDKSKPSAPNYESGRKQADELEERFINAVQRLPLTQQVALLELVELAVHNGQAETPQNRSARSIIQASP